MGGEPAQTEFLIVTPTYHREALLARFVKQVRSQAYPHWKLLVVHDGANPDTGKLMGRLSAADARIGYLETSARGNDFGVTPRLEGLRHAVQAGAPPYAVFWDDDDYFVKNALELIARSLRASGSPDLLLSPNYYRNRVIPPPGLPIAALGPGQVTTGNFTVRTALALRAYEQIITMKEGASHEVMYVQDFLLLDQLRKLEPACSMHIADGSVIGMHDGLRPQVYIRNRLGIPPLGLLGRERIGKLMFWKGSPR